MCYCTPSIRTPFCPSCNQAMFLRIAELRAEVETLRRERDDFHMNYRMKCDEETKRLELENADLRQRVRELESALEAADDGRNYANQLLTEQSQRVRELQERVVLLEAMHQSALLTVGVRNQELTALRKRIDDAPVVMQVGNGSLISRKDLQK